MVLRSGHGLLFQTHLPLLRPPYFGIERIGRASSRQTGFVCAERERDIVLEAALQFLDDG
jgi:hypothetical protein